MAGADITGELINVVQGHGCFLTNTGLASLGGSRMKRQEGGLGARYLFLGKWDQSCSSGMGTRQECCD